MSAWRGPVTAGVHADADEPTARTRYQAIPSPVVFEKLVAPAGRDHEIGVAKSLDDARWSSKPVSFVDVSFHVSLVSV